MANWQKGKTYEELYGEERAKEMKLKKRQFKHTSKTKEFLSQLQKGSVRSLKTRRKMGIAKKGNKYWLGKSHSLKTKKN